jgi:aromatic ring-cleaving dioxygenase
MKRFHAHLYFVSESLELARALTERARLLGRFEFVELYERPVGPHPLGMVELQFSEPFYTSAVEWIEANRGDFSALIHPDTGNDLKDHSEGIQWLGQELPLDFKFFELIRERPDLRIH